MKKLFLALFLVLALAPQGFAADAAPPAGDAAKDGQKIMIKEYKFLPDKLTVPLGAKVTWINTDQVPHTVVAAGQFRSAAMDTNDSYTYTFTKPGTYRYFCTLHPTMIGTITVTAAP